MFGLIQESLAPAAVKRAMILMLLYAASILIITAWFALQTGFSHGEELLRGLIRVAGITGLAFWLLTLNKNAWWLSIVACGLLAALGVIGILAIGFAGAAYDTTLLWLIPKLAAPVYFLGHATLLLARRESRQAFGVSKA